MRRFIRPASPDRAVSVDQRLVQRAEEAVSDSGGETRRWAFTLTLHHQWSAD